MKHTITLFAAHAASQTSAIDASGTAVDFVFRAHVEDGMTEQDVYVLTCLRDTTRVHPPGPDFRNMSAPFCLACAAGQCAHGPGRHRPLSGRSRD